MRQERRQRDFQTRNRMSKIGNTLARGLIIYLMISSVRISLVIFRVNVIDYIHDEVKLTLKNGRKSWKSIFAKLQRRRKSVAVKLRRRKKNVSKRKPQRRSSGRNVENFSEVFCVFPRLAVMMICPNPF
jgi:hypothetical protein